MANNKQENEQAHVATKPSVDSLNLSLSGSWYSGPDEIIDDWVPLRKEPSKSASEKGTLFKRRKEKKTVTFSSPVDDEEFERFSTLTEAEHGDAKKAWQEGARRRRQLKIRNLKGMLLSWTKAAGKGQSDIAESRNLGRQLR